MVELLEIISVVVLWPDSVVEAIEESVVVDSCSVVVEFREEEAIVVSSAVEVLVSRLVVVC